MIYFNKGKSGMSNKEGRDLNSTQFRSILQYFTTAAASYAVGRGWLPQDVASELSAALVIAIPALLAIWQGRDKARITEAAKVKDENGNRVQIVAPDAIANSITKPNVIPASSVDVVTKDDRT